ncbi:class I SAM-dependent methyltransferase [Streptococcus moroccensis]|uniref:16S rRNA (Guanine1207-N2)-methyltransferase n=1 Tax=Streptococcus moroccensis TaxID=1451356 RepID=A0ABT9YU90_9STRE|nr:class I SAM-dependent methyltransferase [Streptococcus moroccensis]MDQ0223162.1 16S rRNA (guanine1207-N2)-methyltransferase [Streptococcus moroccensis]
MSKMYYAENPDAAHDIHQLKVTLLNQDFVFWTDAGVFSKKMIDFGSQVLLNALDFQKGQTVLDVGCGYGPLGIALAKCQGIFPTMVDVNLRALDLAQKNAELNGVNATILQSDGYDQVSGHFDHIISNPPIRAGKQVVHRIITESIDHLNPNGTFTIVIQKKQGAPSAKAKMEGVFGNVTTLRKEKGYYILQSIKDESC